MSSSARTVAAKDRAYLARIADAVAANPFGEERDAIDRELSGLGPRASREQVVERLLALVDERLRAMTEDRPRILSQLAGEDRELMRLGLLFSMFHRVAPSMDAYIAAELTGERRPMPEVRQAVAELVAHGTPVEQAEQQIAIAWQMRRAYWFVEHDLPGTSRSMRRLRAALWSAVFGQDLRLYERVLHRRMEDFSTFFAGETGTGKGTAAAAIGRSGLIAWDARKNRFAHSFAEAFVSVNLVELTETLLESELFGHEKGAFTGAAEAREGLLARVPAHGAIFLDEIGEVPPHVQVKLLGVLQDRAFRPLGSRAARRFSGRVLAATNRPVAERGGLREDLWYRLSATVVEMPTLRARLAEDPDELRVLVRAIVLRLLGEPSHELCESVLAAIARDVGPGYAWPGNVRELAQCVRRVLLTQHYRPEAPQRPQADDALWSATGEGALDAETLLARYCAALHARLGTYEAVAARVGLDRRTVKRHVVAATR